MSHKVTLKYENNEYVVCLGDVVLTQDTDEERAIEAFKHAIKNNIVDKPLSFEEMVIKVEALQLDNVEMNKTYGSMQCGDLKYFYHTGKAFYTGNNKMVLLHGGFDYFYEVLNLASKNQVSSVNDVVELCATAVEKGATYSLTEDGMSIASPAFSYGNVGFNFTNSKINKGTSSEKSTFEAFRKLVLAAL